MIIGDVHQFLSLQPLHLHYLFSTHHLSVLLLTTTNLHQPPSGILWSPFPPLIFGHFLPLSFSLLLAPIRSPRWPCRYLLYYRGLTTQRLSTVVRILIKGQKSNICIISAKGISSTYWQQTFKNFACSMYLPIYCGFLFLNAQCSFDLSASALTDITSEVNIQKRGR